MYYPAVFGHQKCKYLFKLNVLEFNLNYKISLRRCQYLSHDNKIKKNILEYSNSNVLLLYSCYSYENLFSSFLFV